MATRTHFFVDNPGLTALRTDLGGVTGGLTVESIDPIGVATGLGVDNPDCPRCRPRLRSLSTAT